MLLDGHLRLHALKALGAREALCLLSTDDEGFTYNRQINRLTPVQEHKMILTAVRKGISPALIAKFLGINIERIHERQRLLDGIAPEVVEMLKVKMVSQGVFRTLRKMKPMRQIETVELMVSANCFTQTYADMVLAASRPDMLIEKKPSSPPRSASKNWREWSARWKSCFTITRAWRTRWGRRCCFWWLPRVISPVCCAMKPYQAT